MMLWGRYLQSDGAELTAGSAICSSASSLSRWSNAIRRGSVQQSAQGGIAVDADASDAEAGNAGRSKQDGCDGRGARRIRASVLMETLTTPDRIAFVVGEALE